MYAEKLIELNNKSGIDESFIDYLTDVETILAIKYFSIVTERNDTIKELKNGGDIKEYESLYKEIKEIEDEINAIVIVLNNILLNEGNQALLTIELFFRSDAMNPPLTELFLLVHNKLDFIWPMPTGKIESLGNIKHVTGDGKIESLGNIKYVKVI